MQQRQRSQAQTGTDNRYAAVYIAPDDDVPSICGKVDTASHQRVVLIAAKGNRSLTAMMGMPLLRRHADATGKEVFIVSRRRRLRTLARQEGLPAAATVKGLRLDARPAARPEIPLWGGQRLALPSYASIAKGMMLAGVGIAALVAALMLVPTATVVVYPATVDAAQEITIIASASASEIDLTGLIIPARRISTVMETNIAVPTSGMATVGDTRASGTVTFTNLSGRALLVPAGTPLSTATGVRFLTQQEVTLAAAEGSVGQALVVAAVAGAVGNVAAGAINLVEGELQSVVQVTNAEPTQGGTDRQGRAVAQADLELLRTLAVKVLTDRGAQALESQRQEAETLYEETISVDILDEQLSHALGEETDWVLLNARAEVIGLAVHANDVLTVVASVIAGSSGRNAYVLPETVTVEPVALQSFIRDEGEVWFTINASGKVAPSFDPEAVRREVAGRNKDDALLLLAQHYSPNAPPEVRTSPGLLPRLPQFGWRINIEAKAASGQ